MMNNENMEVMNISVEETNNFESRYGRKPEEKLESRKELINKIRSLDFAVVELSLYLDTHNTDRKALNLHKEYSEALKELKEKYEKLYGPLSFYCPDNKWRWVQNPWPWERGNF